MGEWRKEFDLDRFLERMEKNRPSEAEREKRDKDLLAKETIKFETALCYEIRKQFGIHYFEIHKHENTTSLPEIEKHIDLLFASCIGACYTGREGNGKTNVLLEIFIQICWLEWFDYIKTHGYPNPGEFISRTCHFAYTSQICDLLGHREKAVTAKYNFIDDLGVEDAQGYVLSALDGFFEDIYHKGQGIILSSNCSKKDLEGRKGYERIMSRLHEKCKFYILPSVDRRKLESGKPNPHWRDC